MANLGVIRTSDINTNRQSEQMTAQVNQLSQVPFMSGVWLKGVALASGNNAVSHKLGQSYQGYWVTNLKGAAAAIYNANSGDATKVITLNASAACTVDLWVF